MPIKIGLRDLAALPPNSILWDSQIRGLCARRQRSETITWSVVYRSRDQQQHWFKLGRHPILTPTLARQEAAKVLRSVIMGDDPAADRYDSRHGMTVAQLADAYMADVESGRIGKKPTTIRGDKSRIKRHVLPKLGKLKVSSVTSEDIENFMHSMPIGSQARNTGLIGSIFSYAVKKKLCTINPCIGVEKPPATVKMRRLSNNEYIQFAEALKGGVVSDIFMLLSVTGFRSSEARLLKWSEVDVERSTVILEDSKSGRSVRPLSGAAISIIKRQKIGSEYVFDYGNGLPINSLRHHWLQLGLDKSITPHCLRHSFASLGADLGLSDNTIASLLGHARSSVTSRYLHGSDKALIESANLVAEATLKLMKK